MDSQKYSVDLVCPLCSGKFAAELRRADVKAEVVCPHCHKPIEIDATQAAEAFKAAEKRVADIARSFGSSFKF